MKGAQLHDRQIIFILHKIVIITGLTANLAVSLIGVRSCLMLSGLLSSLGLIVCALVTNEITLLFGLLLVGENGSQLILSCNKLFIGYRDCFLCDLLCRSREQTLRHLCLILPQ